MILKSQNEINNENIIENNDFCIENIINNANTNKEIFETLSQVSFH